MNEHESRKELCADGGKVVRNEEPCQETVELILESTEGAEDRLPRGGGSSSDDGDENEEPRPDWQNKEGTRDGGQVGSLLVFQEDGNDYSRRNWRGVLSRASSPLLCGTPLSLLLTVLLALLLIILSLKRVRTGNAYLTS